MDIISYHPNIIKALAESDACENKEALGADMMQASLLRRCAIKPLLLLSYFAASTKISQTYE